MEKFNHDPDAAGYDQDVLNEGNPIRAGYECLLTWIAIEANSRRPHRVLDLGIGTGNLSAKIDAYDIVGVDSSKKMLAIAADKLRSRKCNLIQSDILEFLSKIGRPYDCIVSSYAIHHLEPGEREKLFQFLWSSLRPGGVALLGDLMFESAPEREKMLVNYRKSGRSELANNIEDEFFWDLEVDVQALKKCGFEIVTKRFSDLSWGICATRPRA